MHAIQNITQLLGQTQWYHLREKHISCHDGQSPWTELVCSLECVWGGACQKATPVDPTLSCSLTLSLL